MGMNSKVFGIGPFSDEIKDCLSYSEEQYEGTESGRLVTTSLLHCTTNPQSRALAELLGVELWDFNTHHLNAVAIAKKWEEVSPASLDESWWAEEDVDQFISLARAGFTLIYMPEG